MDEQNEQKEQLSKEAIKSRRKRKTMKLLEERFERARIQDDMRYDNLNATVQIQAEELLVLTQRIEQLERDAAVHPLKKLVGKKAKKDR